MRTKDTNIYFFIYQLSLQEVDLGGSTEYLLTGLSPYTDYTIGVTGRPQAGGYDSDPMIADSQTREAGM